MSIQWPWTRIYEVCHKSYEADFILYKKSLPEFQHGPLQKQHIAGGVSSTPGNIAEVFFCEVF